MRTDLAEITGTFQFTTSMGRSTMFNNHDVCGKALSIHDLHGEVDNLIADVTCNHLPFQFTTSMGRSTAWSIRDLKQSVLSIHDLHGEVDPTASLIPFTIFPFNSRPPWGGRPPFCVFLKLLCSFNSRPPWGGRPS